MTKDEALKLALEALEGVLDDSPKVLDASISGGLYEVIQCRDAITAIKEALAQPAQEPPSEWALIKNILDEYGLQAISFVADWKAAQPVQEAIYGMNQDDWKDVVAAIAKVRDGRGIYLACRPADVFQDWFLALGTAKVKEKHT